MSENLYINLLSGSRVSHSSEPTRVYVETIFSDAMAQMMLTDSSTYSWPSNFYLSAVYYLKEHAAFRGYLSLSLNSLRLCKHRSTITMDGPSFHVATLCLLSSSVN